MLAAVIVLTKDTKKYVMEYITNKYEPTDAQKLWRSEADGNW